MIAELNCDDELTTLLCAYDYALAEGHFAVADRILTNAPATLQARLDRSAKCVRLLNAAFGRKPKPS
jgi:regulator of sigma D